MRLDSVEIVGFKSFCDRQELSFRGGLTGIVGPNGCGKSNISDAISWVLGEQSVKSLRGTSMEDVIFAGSQSRQPLAMAEVNLKVSGLNGTSPDGAPECVVTRRLYRNGESEYLMNGKLCRLRDIHELFMDTGLGSKAYSIIEQGKIGMILSSKPADRRALIEEAAGITKYKARRRQTALKLEAAQQNLLRVNDIVHEVEKQLESLKRQAGRARRYRVLTGEMKAVERVLFGRRFVELSGKARGLGARLFEEKEREGAASLALEAAAESEQETTRESQVDLLGRLAALQNARESVTGSAERAGADLLKLAAETEELERERERVARLRDEARARGDAAEASLADLVAERDDAARRAAGAHAHAEGLARAVDGLQSERDGLLGRLSSLEEIVASHSAFDEGVRALLARPEGVDVIGVVADAVETDSADERA